MMPKEKLNLYEELKETERKQMMLALVKWEKENPKAITLKA